MGTGAHSTPSCERKSHQDPRAAELQAMAKEDGFEQEITEGTERKASRLGPLFSRLPSLGSFRSQPSMCGIATRQEPGIGLSTDL